MIEYPREQIARACLLAMYGFVFTGESICDEAERIFLEPNPRAVRAVKLADDIEDLLDATPAPSALGQGHGLADPVAWEPEVGSVAALARAKVQS